MKRSLTVILWPLLLGFSAGVLGLVIESGYGWLGFNLLYLCLAASLAFLELVLPYEERWRVTDREISLDVGHTVLTKGAGQVAVVSAGLFGMAEVMAPQASGLWPSELPLLAQVLLGLMIADFGLYWAHRLAHEFRPLWQFHLIHHSVRRLWFFNTGRFHVFDGFVSLILSQPLLYLAGAPSHIFMWVTGITAIIGLLTHCNVDMRTGVFDLIFNTPRLHRWHHSRNPLEGNKNYGENLVFWDRVFGTYFNPPRRPPVNIGTEDQLPGSLFGQLVLPFQKLASRGASAQQDQGREVGLGDGETDAAKEPVT